jgi:predicted Zn finger-like uncharacterized protein
MALQARCPHCQKSYTVGNQLQDKTVRCKQCGRPFVVGGATPGRAADESAGPAGQSGTRPRSTPEPVEALVASVDEEDRPAPRRRDRDDEGGEDRPRKGGRKRRRSSSHVGLYLILGGVGALVLAGVVVGVVLLANRSGGSLGGIDLGGSWPDPTTLHGAPDTIVTFHVAGVVNQYTRDEVVDQINRLADPGGIVFGSSNTVGDRMTVLLTPVRDPQACAKKVTFGTVQGVSGRVITVVANKVEGPPANADALTRALYNLKSSNQGRRAEAIRQIKDLPPDAGRRAEVAQALETVIAAEPDLFARANAVEALGIWGTAANVPALLRALGDPQHPVQTNAIHALARLRDERAIGPIAERLESNWPDAQNALRVFGAAAEPPLLKAMDSPSGRTRELACEVLQEVGTKACVPTMIRALEERARRERALKTLTRLRPPEAAGPVAKWLEDAANRADASRALIAIGPAAEPAVLPVLKHKDLFTRAEACRVLKEIGTAASLPALQALAQQDQGTARAAAEAIQAIKARS